MPSKQKPILFLREKIAEMLQETSKVSRPVFGAAALLLVAVTLMLTVVIGLNQGQPHTAKLNPMPPVKAPEVKAVTEVQAPLQPQAVQPTAQTIAVTPKPTVQPPEIKQEVVSLGKPQRPIQGATTVPYGWQIHPVFKDWRFHSGIDIMAGEGETVVAIWPGEVKEIFQDKNAGLTVAVVSGEYTVYYGSLATAEVRKDTKIKAGAKVGTAGTSQAEPYPHLHLAIKKGEGYIDPAEKF